MCILYDRKFQKMVRKSTDHVQKMNKQLSQNIAADLWLLGSLVTSRILAVVWGVEGMSVTQYQRTQAVLGHSDGLSATVPTAKQLHRQSGTRPGAGPHTIWSALADAAGWHIHGRSSEGPEHRPGSLILRSNHSHSMPHYSRGRGEPRSHKIGSNILRKLLNHFLYMSCTFSNHFLEKIPKSCK